MNNRSARDLGILNKCGAPATYVYQWPGIYATYICQEHLSEIIELTKKFGLEMKYKPLEIDGKQCEKREVNAEKHQVSS